MPDLEFNLIQCPYCWEEIEIQIDPSVEEQEYVEDCSVCCRPITIQARCFEGEPVEVTVKSQDD